MLKAVIFDFDGTLADTIPGLCAGVNLTMEKYGYPTHTPADILTFINNGARMLITRAMPAHLRNDEALISRVLADYDAFYSQTYLQGATPYAGLTDAVSALHDRLGLCIAVLSNKQDAYVKRLTREILPQGSYQAAVGVAPGDPTKPDPRLTQKALNALGVAPHECVMVGDSDIDIRTAALAGMPCISVTWGFRSEEFLLQHGATHLARTPDELVRVIELMKEGFKE